MNPYLQAIEEDKQRSDPSYGSASQQANTQQKFNEQTQGNPYLQAMAAEKARPNSNFNPPPVKNPSPPPTPTPQTPSILDQAGQVVNTMAKGAGDLAHQLGDAIASVLNQHQQDSGVSNPNQPGTSTQPQSPIDPSKMNNLVSNPHNDPLMQNPQEAQPSAQLHGASLPAGMPVPNLIDAVIKNPVDTLIQQPASYVLNNTGAFGEAIKTAATQIYQDPNIVNPLYKAMKGFEQTYAASSPDAAKQVTAFNDPNINPLAKVMDFSTKTQQGVIQGAARVYGNFIPSVQGWLDTQLAKPVKGEDVVANTVGQTIGTIGAFLLGGEAAAAAKFGKVALPLTFAALGQTSLPSNTPGDVRGRNAIFDAAAGALLDYFKPIQNLSKLDSIKSLTKSMSVLSAQTYADSRSAGATNEQALENVKNNAIVMLGLHGVFVAGKAGEMLTKSQTKEGQLTMTPDQVREQVNTTNLKGTDLGNHLLDQANQADAQGKDVAINGVAAQKSPVAKALNLDTPQGLAVDVSLVDRQRMVLLGETNGDNANPNPAVSPESVVKGTQPIEGQVVDNTKGSVVPASESQNPYIKPGETPTTPVSTNAQQTANPQGNQSASQPTTPAVTNPNPTPQEVNNLKLSPEDTAKAQQHNIDVPPSFNSPGELQSYQKLINDPQSMVADYIKKFGNHVNADNAKQLFPQYNETNAVEYDKAGGNLSKLVFNKLLQDNKNLPNKEILFTAGGTGSGKSTATKNDTTPYAIRFDSTLSNFDRAKGYIDKALSDGYKVRLAYVYRDPTKAFKEGVLRRFQQGEARTVPINTHVSTHINAHDSAVKLAEHYKGNPNVDVKFFNNSGGVNDVKQVGLDFVKGIQYDKQKLTEQLHEHTKQLTQSGQLTSEQHHALTGEQLGSKLPSGSEKGNTGVSGQNQTTGAPGSGGQSGGSAVATTPGRDTTSGSTASRLEVPPKLQKLADRAAQFKTVGDFTHSHSLESNVEAVTGMKKQYLGDTRPGRAALEILQKNGFSSMSDFYNQLKSGNNVDIKAKETALKDAYSKVDPQKLEEQLFNIWQELDIAEAGARIPIKADGQVTGILARKSTFPSWIPEQLRLKNLVDSTKTIIQDGVTGFKYPANSTRARAVLDEVFNQLDHRLGVDTSAIRSDIMNGYATQSATNQTEKPFSSPAVPAVDTGKAIPAVPKENPQNATTQLGDIPKPPEELYNAQAAFTKMYAGMPINTEDFIKEDIKPFINVLKEMGFEMTGAISPKTASKDAMKASDIVRQGKAAIANRSQVQATKYGSVQRFFNKFSDDQNIANIAHYEKTGEFLKAPAGYSKLYSESMIESGKIMQQVFGEDKINLIENYVRRAFVFGSAADETQGTSYLKHYVSTLSANKSPTRGRVLDMPIDEALKNMQDRGIKVKMASTNPEELRQWSMANANRALEYKNIWTTLKAGELIQFFKKGAEIPPGLVKLNDRAAQVFYPAELTNGATTLVNSGQYYANPDVARILNNAVSQGLDQFATFRGIRQIENIMNSVQLGLSAFHLTGSAINASISDLAVGVRNIGTGNLGAGIVQFTRGLVPLASFTTDVYRGQSILNGLKNNSPEAWAFLEKRLNPAGGRLGQDARYRNQIFDKMVKNFMRGNVLGVAVRLPMAALEVTAKPLMEFAIPRIKLAAFAELADSHIQSLGKDATPEQVQREMAKAWDSIDNRFGQLVYDNLFWHKVNKDIMMTITRSVGWNLGTLREIGGGTTIDLLGTVKGQGVSDKTLYTIGLVLYAAMIGAVYMYLHTGKMPKDMKDYFNPENGLTDKNGNPIRVTLPTYMKDLFSYTSDPLATFMHKSSPILNYVSTLISNKDYLGNMVHNPADPLQTQLQQVGAFTINNLMPFAIQQAFNKNQSKNQPLEQKIEAFFGFTQAPQSVIQSDRQKAINAQYQAIHGSTTGLTPEQQQVNTLKAQARADIISGIPPQKSQAMQQLIQMKAFGNGAAIKTFVQGAHLTSEQRAFKTLPKQDKQQIIKQYGHP